MAAVLRDSVDSKALIINGAEDHVHLLIQLSRRFAVMKVVQQAKIETSKWLKRKLPCGREFSWQSGYGAFSVSNSSIESVSRYIRNQVQHHQRMDFQEEFRHICKRHEMNLDEHYAWD